MLSTKESVGGIEAFVGLAVVSFAMSERDAESRGGSVRTSPDLRAREIFTVAVGG